MRALLRRLGALLHRPPQEPFTAEQYYAFGLEFLDAQDHTNAWNAFMKVCTMEPGNYRAKRKLGELALRHHPDAGLVHFKEANRLAPPEEHCYAHLGVCWKKKRRRDVAKRMFEMAVHLTPNDPFARLQLGIWFYEEFHLEPAEEHLRRCLELDPGCAEAYTYLGKLLIHRLQPEEAIAVLKRGIIVSPRTATLRYCLGETLMETGAFAEAAEQFRIGAECNGHPGYYEWYHLGLAYRGARNFRSAIHCFEQAKRAKKDESAPYFQLSVIYTEMGDLGELIVNLQGAAERGSTEAQQWLEQHGYAITPQVGWN